MMVLITEMSAMSIIICIVKAVFICERSEIKVLAAVIFTIT